MILRDLLDLVHLLTRVKAAGPVAATHGPAGEADASRAQEMSDAIEMNALTRAWSMLMKGLTETNIAPDPSAAGEMALIRLCFAADLPTPDEALRALKKNSSDGVASRNSSAKPAPTLTPATAAMLPRVADADKSVPKQPEPLERGAQDGETVEPTVIDIEPPLSQRSSGDGPWLRSFKDVLKLASQHRDAKLRTELEAYVHMVSFAQGRIELRLAEAAPSNLAGRLTQRLKEWTGQQWLVTVNTKEEGAQTVRDARVAEVMAHPMVQKTMALFPGAEVTSIREVESAIAPAVDDTDEEPPTDPDADFDRDMGDGPHTQPNTGKA